VFLRVLLVLALSTGALPAAAQTTGPILTLLGPSLRTTTNSVLGLMGFLVVPDMAASSIQINRSSGEDDTALKLTQIGSGFTVAPSFPLYLEGFLGLGRYDPRFVFSDGTQQTRLPVRWNTLTLSGGVGWDFPIAENLVLRPMVNISLGHVESDVSLLARLIEFKTDLNLRFLKGGQLNSYGYGGSLVLDYGIYREGYEIDVELRYTHVVLENFAGSSRAVQGQAQPKTLGLWSRWRFPTGYEAFTRPVRLVAEFSHSRFFGEEARGFGFEHMTKVGGGLEVDIGRYELGGLGLYAQRVRLMGSGVFGPNVRGFGLGLGISF